MSEHVEELKSTYFKVVTKGIDESREEISSHDYDQLINAKEILHNALKLEQVLLLSIENLIGFEKEVVGTIVDVIYSGVGKNYHESSKAQMMFQRHISNIILTSDLFLDKGKGYYWRMFGAGLSKSEQKQKKEEFNTLTKKAFDESPAFKVCNTLINYLKHNDLAIHGTSSGYQWDKEQKHLSFRINAYITKSELIKNYARFKKLDENGWLSQLSEKMEVLPLVKEYISLLHSLLCTLRENASHNLESSSKLLENSLPAEENSIVEVQKIRNNEVIEKYYLLLEWEDVRRALVNKYTNLIKLQARYVGHEYNLKQ
jgi:hypothetical protein